MITAKKDIYEYLDDYHRGNITMGLGIGLLDFDFYLRFKAGEFTVINGLDNVGKTAWMLWYFLALSVKHDLKWCIWSGENKSGQLVRQMIEWKTGKKLKDLSFVDVSRQQIEIEAWFTFVDNKNSYTNKQLYTIFNDSGCDGALIDPFTGMKREYTHAGNYDFLNETREFCNSTQKSIYVNTHVVSEAARRTYAIEHEYSGYPMPPSKSQSEGGQPFANRPDNFITIHRLVGHPTMKYKTLIYTRKIKDTETGGEVVAIEEPIQFDYNNGLGFTLNGQNILNPISIDDLALSKLQENKFF